MNELLILSFGVWFIWSLYSFNSKPTTFNTLPLLIVVLGLFGFGIGVMVVEVTKLF